MQTGKVILVGAGPGDPDLITLKGKRAIEVADVIVYDNLVPDEMLQWARPDCQLIYAGKRPGKRANGQTDIDTLLVSLAKSGCCVVRLKGGDPFVFGRGGEELMALREQDIPFEVVPAVTAAIGASAYTGVPLTHRDYSSSVVFITGHENPDKPESSVDWSRYATLGATLCIYMGMGRLHQIRDKLMQHGMAPDTPALIVHAATTPQQSHFSTTLENLAETADHHALKPPSLIILGEVARFSDQLTWFDPQSSRDAGFNVEKPKPGVALNRLAKLVNQCAATPPSAGTEEGLEDHRTRVSSDEQFTDMSEVLQFR